jgi:hypothetical protein
MHDESHPYRTESPDYPQRVKILKSSPWHDGEFIETERELICIRPVWDIVVVIDKNLLALSFAEPSGKWN